MIIVLSIGNPGSITRHSVGHFIYAHLVTNYALPQPTKHSTYSFTSNEEIILVKSNTYMNESSKAWIKFQDKQRVPSDAIVLILYDDFESDLGVVKIGKFKKNESHNGIRNLMTCLSDRDNVYKLGVGIGPKPVGANKESMASWVLSGFKQNEKEKLGNISLPKVVAYLDEIIETEKVGDVNKLNAKITKQWKEYEET
ncbi:Peptidyl-tRNA hydrolase [Spathaspora sp. JA1]|nr:Peptidyl-tRNA hydrolase [Spathaspora sp. JA1]